MTYKYYDSDGKLVVKKRIIFWVDPELKTWFKSYIASKDMTSIEAGQKLLENLKKSVEGEDA